MNTSICYLSCVSNFANIIWGLGVKGLDTAVLLLLLPYLALDIY